MALDCRSETGKTVGLIDSLMTIAHILKERDLSAPEVEEALKDLASTEEIQSLLDLGHRIKNREEMEKYEKTHGPLPALDDLFMSQTCHICKSKMTPDQHFVYWVCSKCGARDSMLKY